MMNRNKVTRVKHTRVTEKKINQVPFERGEIAISSSNRSLMGVGMGKMMELLNEENVIISPVLEAKPEEYPVEGKVIIYFFNGELYVREADGREKKVQSVNGGGGRIHEFKQRTITDIPKDTTKKNPFRVKLNIAPEKNKELIRPPVELLFLDYGEEIIETAANYNDDESDNFLPEERVFFDGRIRMKTSFSPQCYLHKNVYLGKIMEADIAFEKFQEVFSLYIASLEKNKSVRNVRFLILNGDGKVYTIEWGYTPVYVCDIQSLNKTLIKSEGFTRKFFFKTEALNRIPNITNPKILFLLDETTSSEASIRFKIKPKDFFLVPKKDVTFKNDVEEITSLTLNGRNLEGVRLGCSFDGGVTWQAYKDGKWNNIDGPGIEEIVSQGMTSEEFNSIDDFQDFNSSKKIRVAFVFAIGPLWKSLKIDWLKIGYNIKGSWKPGVLGQDFYYCYRNKMLEIEYYKTNSIKINY